MIQQIINDERFTNIQKAQAGLTKLFAEAEKSDTFYTVLKNDEPLGVLLPRKMWQSLVEDLEALSSPNYLIKIAKARADKKRISSDEMKRRLGI